MALYLYSKLVGRLLHEQRGAAEHRGAGRLGNRLCAGRGAAAECETRADRVAGNTVDELLELGFRGRAVSVKP